MHINNVTLAVMVDGKSLYEDKNKVYLPFGTEYQIFVKNNNDFDLLIQVNASLFHEDIFLVKAKSKRTIKGFSEDEIFYSFRFIEKTKEIKDNKSATFFSSNLNLNIYKKDEPIKSIISSQKTKQIDPFGRSFLEIESNKLISDFNDKDKIFYSNAPDVNMEFSAHTNSIDLNSVNQLHISQNPEGMQTYGKPVNEKSDPYGVLCRTPIASFSFDFIGVDENNNRLIKPLFGKDLINCKVCGTKSKPSACYCVKCGSYIVKTAILIEEEVNNKSCCGKILPEHYLFCPKCASPVK